MPLVQAETGATLRVTKTMQVPSVSARFRRYAKGATEKLDIAGRAPGHAHHRPRPRRHHRRCRAPGPGRRGGVHHLVQLPAGQHGRQARSCARHGQHRRGEARPAGSAGHRQAGRDLRGGRLPARRRQRGRRPGSRAGRGARRVARRRHDLLHRLHRRGSAHRLGRRRRHETPAARAGRQGRGHRVRRRRPQEDHRRHRQRVVVPLRPDLHRPHPGARPAGRLRPGRRRAPAVRRGP